MPSSKLRGLLACALGTCASLWGSSARAEGFALERFYHSGGAGSFFVLDDLKLEGRLGGAVSFLGGYARRPYHVEADGKSLDVVSDQAFANVVLSVLYDRFRLSVDLDNPIYLAGKSGKVGQRSYQAPAVDLSAYPDRVTDLRLGVDARVLGEVQGPWRLGLSAQLWVPSAEQELYLSDGHPRGMFRALFAGDWANWTYAAQLGVHVRSLNLESQPGAPRGSELLFALGLMPQFSLGTGGTQRLALGPEVFGTTAISSFFGKTSTALEAMLSARYDSRSDNGNTLRIKLGLADGLLNEFGAPEWRAVFAIETFGRLGKTEAAR